MLLKCLCQDDVTLVFRKRCADNNFEETEFYSKGFFQYKASFDNSNYNEVDRGLSILYLMGDDPALISFDYMLESHYVKIVRGLKLLTFRVESFSEHKSLSCCDKFFKAELYQIDEAVLCQ